MLDLTTKQQMIADLRDNGGFTYWLNGQERTSGYCVGNNNYSLKIDAVNTLTFESFAHYAHILILKGVQVDAIGGWYDSGEMVVYLDIVRHVRDLGDAIQLAKLNQELAIYDLANQECIDI